MLLLKQNSSQAKALDDARGLFLQIRSFEFLLAIVVLKQLLECTNGLSLYLQSKQIDLGAAITSVNATLSEIQN